MVTFPVMSLPWLHAEDIAGAVECVDEGVGIGRVVVDVATGTRGGRRAEQTHQRLGTVVTGANAHVVLVEHLADVVGVNAAESEADGGAAGFDVGRPVDRDVVAMPL